ncbi:MAG: SDR family NAD(P)-dependent oxidoreductase [Pseudomonadales bacterium]
MDFTGKVVFVTGAASGIGKATALMFGKLGADLLIADIDAPGLSATREALEDLGSKAVAHVFDVSNGAACRQAIEVAVNEFGQLDILCNIAGIAKADNFLDLKDADWDRMVGINLSSVFHLSHAAMPHLIKTGGNIVNMASSAGLVGQAYNTMYCATKAGVVMFTKALAIEFSGKGVRVNAVCPGGVKTPLVDGFTFPEGADMNLFSKLMPLLDMAEPEEIANAVCYLADESSRYITGIALPVDGGQVAG